MNAMDGPMFKALIETADELAKTRGCGPLCFPAMARPGAQASTSGFQSMAGGGESNTSSIGEMENDRITHNAQQAVWGWRELPVPVIAAVHGVAFGAGIQLAAGCDIRFVAPDVRMSILEIRWGISPDMTITHLLPGLIGADVAKELIWTGREVNGEEAVRIGLATHVSEDPRRCHGTRPTIAGKSPHAIRAGKRLVEHAYAEDFASGFALEREEIFNLIGTPNQVESVTAFFEKRTPNYTEVEVGP